MRNARICWSARLSPPPSTVARLPSAALVALSHLHARSKPKTQRSPPSASPALRARSRRILTGPPRDSRDRQSPSREIAPNNQKQGVGDGVGVAVATGDAPGVGAAGVGAAGVSFTSAQE